MKLKKSALMLALLASTSFCNAQYYTLDKQTYGDYTTEYWAETATFGGTLQPKFISNMSTAQSYLLDHDTTTGVVNMKATWGNLTMGWNNAYSSNGGSGDILLFMNGTPNSLPTSAAMSLILGDGTEAGSFNPNLTTGNITTVADGVYNGRNIYMADGSVMTGAPLTWAVPARVIKFSDFGLTAEQLELGVKGIKFINSTGNLLDVTGVALTQNVVLTNPPDPIPEPTSASLLGLVGSLFLLRRRR